MNTFPNYYLPPVKSVLSFVCDGSRYWKAVPDTGPFSPKGMMIWDAPSLSVVRAIWVCGRRILCPNSAGIPARWFSIARNFEQVKQAIRGDIDPPDWGDWPTLDVVNGATLELVDAAGAFILSGVQIALWGEELTR